jgi:DNA polymerase-3 subunit alpha
MGAEGALRKFTDCGLAELKELRDGELRKVGGVVTGLQRKYTKKGDLMGVFTLEDLESAVEVMVFPRTMQEYGMLLADDAIVVVKGRLDGREEPAKIVAMEVTRPQLVLDGGPPLRLVLPAATLSETMVTTVKRILLDHPGDSPVYLKVGTKTLRLPDEFNVDTSNGLVAELRTVLGESGVIL